MDFQNSLDELIKQIKLCILHVHMHMLIIFTKQVSSNINHRPYFHDMSDAEILLIVFFVNISHYSVRVTHIGQWIKLITTAMCNCKLLHKLIAYYEHDVQ